MAILNWIDKWVRKPIRQQWEVHQMTDLASIQDTDVNLVYWKRPVDEDIDLFIQYLIQDGFPSLNMAVTKEDSKKIVAEHFDKIHFYSAGKTKLTKDVVQLIHLFMDVVQADRVRLIMKVVQDDSCRKFHTDAYDLRLLCTYLGKGTEWLPEEFVNRNKLINGTNNEIVRDWTEVQCMEPFEVAILKGEPNARLQGGIVHRSPPIEEADEKRFLLRLDFQNIN